MVNSWGKGANWKLDGSTHPHEANYLKLDISKAKSQLGWEPRWNLATSLKKITDWHYAWLTKDDVQAKCLQYISEYQQTTI